MENKINIAELLTDCPRGMELDCVLCENVTFGCIVEGNCFPIQIQTPEGDMLLSKYGCTSLSTHAKCVIFPKGKTTWEGFVPPCKFKDGDILTKGRGCICIYKGPMYYNNNLVDFYCGYRITDRALVLKDCKNEHFGDIDEYHLATEEEKQKLFQAIKDNGYKWNAETKILERLIQPKFHKGDWIIFNGLVLYIKEVVNGFYRTISKGGIANSYDWDIDNIARLWTIQDARDGDVLFHSDSASSGIFIFKEILQRGTIQKVICHCDYDYEDGFCLGENHTCCWADSKILHPATKGHHDLLFQKMKGAGYKWNAEAKTLEKLPKFKVGDKITNGKTSITIGYIDDEYYYEVGRNIATRLFIKNQDEWNLIPKRFDITTLKPFDKVLARDNGNSMWIATLFSHLRGMTFYTVGGWYNQCIPYEGNEHLLGKCNDCDEYYKNWTNEEK